MKRGVSCLSILLGATMLPGAASSQEAATMPPIPPFECEAMVHYDREMKLPGYILPTSAGPRTCIPFTSSLHRQPEGYRGDYYVTEFTDEQLRRRSTACEQDKACRKAIFDRGNKTRPPNPEAP